MKIFEITNAQDQLALLRIIIDNTWAAIKQQAEAEAKRKATKKPSKPKAPRIPSPKLAPTVRPITPPSPKPQIASIDNQQKAELQNQAQPNAMRLTPTEREELAKRTVTQIGLTTQ
jgi:hypothetical protein